MAKYHVNPKTGRPNICRASKRACPLGGAEAHFGTREAAQAAYERSQGEALLPKAVKKPEAGERRVGGHYEGERDIVEGRPGRWSTHILWGSPPRPTFFPDDAGRQDPPESLPKSFESEEWRRVVRPAELSGALPGLEQAQEAFLKSLNGEEKSSDPERLLYREPVSQHADELVRRALRGEASKLSEECYDRNFLQVGGKEALFFNLTQGSRDIASFNTVDSALVFPERDLLPLLERAGVSAVSVAPLSNGREQGLVYTVLSRSGDTRSFSLYEHRNTDSLIIGGATNWDPEAYPHGPHALESEGEGSKNTFFAEFSWDTPKRQVAETLAYFLKSAQEGTLESDRELVASLERLDWGAILSERLPGFREFLEREREESSFQAWEEEF